MPRCQHHISLLGWKDGTTQPAVDALGVELERMAGLDDPAAVGCYDNAARQLLQASGQALASRYQTAPARKPAAEPARPGPGSSAGARPNRPAAVPLRPDACGLTRWHT
jgi:hypothetical protein